MGLEIVTIYVATVVVFLGADYFGLSYMIRPLFEKYLGDALTDSFRLIPALVFYLFYVVGLLYFVSLPAYANAAPGQALLGGAFLGAIAYGTYEFSNYATLRAWHWKMVAADLTWGTVLTGFAAWSGVSIALAIYG